MFQIINSERPLHFYLVFFKKTILFVNTCNNLVAQTSTMIVSQENIHMLKELYDQNIDTLYRFAYFKLNGHEQESMDIIHDAFYKVGVELKSGKKIDNLKWYLYRCICNLINDYFRKNKPVSLETTIEETWDIALEESRVEDIADAKLEVEKIYRILAGLNSDDKDMFLLRYVEEMNPKEIAQIYEKDINTITVRLHRIKNKVTRQMWISNLWDYDNI